MLKKTLHKSAILFNIKMEMKGCGRGIAAGFA